MELLEWTDISDTTRKGEKRRKEGRNSSLGYLVEHTLCLPRIQETNPAAGANTGDKEKRREERRRREETNAKFNKETGDKKKFSPAAGFLSPVCTCVGR